MPPQYGEGCRAIDHGPAQFLGVKAREQQSGFNRTILSGVEIYEIHPVSPIQAPHESYFFPAQGALAVEPDPHLWLLVLHVAMPVIC
jgi:hypothetical protein